jgi:hypothetical protein
MPRTLNYARPGPDVYQRAKRFYFALTPAVLVSLLSIIVGLACAGFAMSQDLGWGAFLAMPFFMVVATAQAICAFALTPRGLLSSRTTGLDLALLVATWVLGFGGSVFAVTHLW